MVATIDSQELDCVDAGCCDAERGGRERKWRVAGKRPRTDYIAVYQSLDGLITVVEVGVSRSQVEAQSVTARSKASNVLPDERSLTLQEDSLVEGQTGERRRKEYRARTS